MEFYYVPTLISTFCCNDWNLFTVSKQHSNKFEIPVGMLDKIDLFKTVSQLYYFWIKE